MCLLIKFTVISYSVLTRISRAVISFLMFFFVIIIVYLLIINIYGYLLFSLNARIEQLFFFIVIVYLLVFIIQLFIFINCLMYFQASSSSLAVFLFDIYQHPYYDFALTICVQNFKYWKSLFFNNLCGLLLSELSLFVTYRIE